MSIESWMAEFYPIPAKLMYGSSDEACILHSLRRYEGLKPENLLKHGLKLKDYVLMEPDTNQSLGDVFVSLCSLCQVSHDILYRGKRTEMYLHPSDRSTMYS